MTTQEARDARDEGIAAAADHADRINPKWQDLAYAALCAYAEHHPTFTIEQLRRDLNGTLVDPPSLRAWGAVAQRAQRSGIVRHDSWTEADDPAVHCNTIRVWRSTLVTTPPPALRTPVIPLDPARRLLSLEATVRAYLTAEAEVNEATRPLNSHAQPRQLPHGSPLRAAYLDARIKLIGLVGWQ